MSTPAELFEKQSRIAMLKTWYAANPFVDHDFAREDLLAKLQDDWALYNSEILRGAVSQAYNHLEPLNAHVNVLLDEYCDLTALEGDTVADAVLTKFLPLRRPGSEEKVQLPEVSMESAFWMCQASKEQLCDRLVEIAVQKKILEKMHAGVLGALTERKIALKRDLAAQQQASDDEQYQLGRLRMPGAWVVDDVAPRVHPDISSFERWLDHYIHAEFAHNPVVEAS